MISSYVCLELRLTYCPTLAGASSAESCLKSESNATTIVVVEITVKLQMSQAMFAEREVQFIASVAASADVHATDVHILSISEVHVRYVKILVNQKQQLRGSSIQVKLIISTISAKLKLLQDTETFNANLALHGFPTGIISIDSVAATMTSSPPATPSPIGTDSSTSAKTSSLNPGDSNKSNILGTVAGCVVAGVATFGILGYWIYCRRRKTITNAGKFEKGSSESGGTVSLALKDSQVDVQVMFLPIHKFRVIRFQ